MSDQPENTEADTTEFAPVEPAPLAAPVEAKVTPQDSKKRTIWAAAAGAGAVLLLVLAGLVGYVVGSHDDDHGRGDFGPGQIGQMMQDFDRGHGQMGQGLSGPMMGDHEDGPQGYGPGQMNQEMPHMPSTQQ